MKNVLLKTNRILMLGVIIVGTSITFKSIGNEPPHGDCKAASQKCIDIPGPFDPKGVLVIVLD